VANNETSRDQSIKLYRTAYTDDSRPLAASLHVFSISRILLQAHGIKSMGVDPWVDRGTLSPHAF